MKKIVLFIFVLSFWGCDGIKDLQPEEDLANAVPPAAINAIKKEYPEARDFNFTTIEKNKVWNSDFKVNVRKMNATVNHLGQIFDTYQVTENAADLPDNAEKYINTNYSGATIKKISEQMGPGGKVIGYKVLITTKEGKEVVMSFDTTGALLLLVALDTNGVEIKDGQNNIKTYSIEQKDLPESIKKVLNEKHPDYKYIKGVVMVQNEKKTYNIVISKDLTNYEYVFDENGAILRSSSIGINAGNGGGNNKPSDKSLEAKDIPIKIKEFLDKNYKGWEFQKGLASYQGERLIGYLIVIKQNNKIFYLNFDANAVFLKVADGGSIGNGQKIELIDPTKLPDAILKVIKDKQNENYKIISASKLSKGNTITYYVNVVKDNINYFYEFDPNGKILDSKKFELPPLPNSKITEKPLEAKDLNSKAKEYLDKKYKGWEYQKGIAIYVDEKLKNYLVAIKVNNTIYYITFDSNWGFVEARKG